LFSELSQGAVSVVSTPVCGETVVNQRFVQIGNFSFLIMGKTKATNFLRLIAFGLVIGLLRRKDELDLFRGMKSARNMLKY
jgi:hypothetical protein